MADGDAPIVVDTGPVAAPLTKAEILAPAVLVAYRRMLSYLFCATIAIHPRERAAARLQRRSADFRAGDPDGSVGRLLQRLGTALWLRGASGGAAAARHRQVGTLVARDLLAGSAPDRRHRGGRHLHAVRGGLREGRPFPDLHLQGLGGGCLQQPAAVPAKLRPGPGLRLREGAALGLCRGFQRASDPGRAAELRQEAEIGAGSFSPAQIAARPSR